MSSFVDLSDVRTKANYTWTLEYFTDYQQSTNSPLFSPSNDQTIKFSLQFTRKLSNKITNRNNYNSLNAHDQTYVYSICLNSKKTQQELSVHYKIAILDSNGQKHFPNEGRAVFFKESVPPNRNNAQNRNIYMHTQHIPRSSTNTYDEADHGWEYTISSEILKKHNLDFDYQLKIFCEVFVLDNPNSQVIDTDVSKLDLPKNQVLEDYGALLKSGDLSDVVLAIGKKGKSKEFNLHKNILAARSPVFSAMFNCDLEEKKKNRVVIPDLAIEVCELLLPYIYTGKIPSMKEYGLELFFASDKYQLDHLKAICERTLITTLSIQTVANTLLMADMHSAAFLKKKCIEYITRNSEQVMATKGWTDMTKSRPELIMELYKDMSSKANPLLNN